MRRLRSAASERLLEAGAQMALDRREMLERAYDAGVRTLSRADTQLINAIEMSSRVAIRLGMLLMPARPPVLADAPRVR